ncbi:hypothetical protein HID58_096306, partial [Brassica napus]
GFTLLMPSHRWDPGIDGGVVLGKRNHKGRRDFLQISDVVDRVQEIGLNGFFGNQDICEMDLDIGNYTGTGGLEWLTGKWVLWLVSLNQPQKTELIIETDLKGNHILAGADVRRLIWHVEEFGVFSRIASLLLVFLKNTNSRSQGSLEGICGVERRESSLIKETLSFSCVYVTVLYIGAGDGCIFQGLCWDMGIFGLEGTYIYVRNGIFSPMLIAQREEFSFLLQQ